MIPYSAEVLLAVLAEYNAWMWPAQVPAMLAGIALIGLVFRPVRGGGRIAAALLVLAWAWTGAVYHLVHFTDIDFWAYGFGVIFLMQSLMIAWSGPVRGRLALGFRGGVAGWAGLGLAIYGLVGYPVSGLMLGREVAEIAVFGTAPAPTVIATLGLLLLVQPARPWYLFAVPIAWCAIGGGVALALPVPEDLALPVAGVVALFALLTKPA